MKEKDTGDLQSKLMSAPDLSRFLSENEDKFNHKSFAEFLQALFQKKKISKAALAKKAGISNVYLYQIFSGERNPSRNRILCLCFGLNTTLDEAQELLKHSGFAQLYVKDKRDAIIIYALVHSMELDEVNDRLFIEHEETLC